MAEVVNEDELVESGALIDNENGTINGFPIVHGKAVPRSSVKDSQTVKVSDQKRRKTKLQKVNRTKKLTIVNDNSDESNLLMKLDTAWKQWGAAPIAGLPQSSPLEEELSRYDSPYDSMAHVGRSFKFQNTTFPTALSSSYELHINPF
mmetsp:Transcript_16330/g.24599  ORF Transcript_16330/g.24599 Transcript_16330/m.24599 type:complete len:148 (+) Transcript_16330:136-579(+)